MAKPNDIVVLQNEIPISMVLYTLKKAKTMNMTTIYNPAPAKSLDQEFFCNVDYLILNETETKFYTEIKPKNIDEAKIACNALKTMGAKHIILTLGDKGALFFGETLIEVEAYAVDVIDTTAAGDTFIGAFISGLVHRKKIKESLKFASAAAAIAITKEGAQKSIPSYEEVMMFMSGKKI